jgi:hypothetical protein
MTQSTDPRPAPKTKSAAAIKVGPESVANSGKAELITTVDTTRTRRHPNRDASAPASGMATIEPAPRQSSWRPREPSPRPARALAKGTSGAHAATATPAMKNTIRVARCSSRPGTVGATEFPSISEALNSLTRGGSDRVDD